MNAAATPVNLSSNPRLNLVQSPHKRRWAWELVCVLAAYLFAGEIGLAVPFTSGNVSPLWPPAGVALAAMIVFGYRIWPAVALGAFLVNFFTDIPHVAAAGIAVGNTVGPLCGTFLLRQLPSFHRSLTRLRDVLGLSICGALCGGAVSATVGAGALFLTGANAWSGFGSAWLMWCFGDGLGVLIVTPLVLTFTRLTSMRQRRHLLELVCLLLGAVVSALVIFDPRLGSTRADAFAFGIFPFVLWGAIRFEAPGAAMVSFLISAVALWGTAHGFGPFIKGNSLQNATLLQSFLGVTSLSGVVLAAVIAERAELIRRQSTREALAQSEKNYRGIVETACEGIWKVNAKFETSFVNGRMAAMLGYTVLEMLGRPVFDFLFESDIEQKWSELQRRLRGVSEQVETRFRKNDGTVFWARVATSPLFAENGQFEGALAMVSDITEQKRAENEERRWREKINLLSRAVEQTEDSIVITDREGTIEYVNPAFEVTTGYAREEAIGKTPRILKSTLHDQEFYSRLWSQLLGGEAFRGTLVNRRKSGELFWAEQTITPIRNDEDQITHFVSVLKDITELHKRQEHEFQLQLARDLQQRFYSPVVSVPGVDLGVSAHLADETGGDYVDIIPVGPDSMFLLVGDASGHGISAAILIALARAYVRAFVLIGMDTGQVLTKVNQMLVDDLRKVFRVENNWFVTLLLVHLDLGKQMLSYASAGHPPGFLLSASGTVDHVLASTGIPLGLFKDTRFASSVLSLEPAHLLLLMTDGATDATNEAGEECGSQRLVDHALRHANQSAQLIADGIYSAVRDFAGKRAADDDLSVMVVKTE
jgi:PAS domain S-box-containing protein